jgi:hypothetical protein
MRLGVQRGDPVTGVTHKPIDYVAQRQRTRSECREGNRDRSTCGEPRLVLGREFPGDLERVLTLGRTVIPHANPADLTRILAIARRRNRDRAGSAIQRRARVIT